MTGAQTRETYVHQAELLLDDDVDPSAPGGAVATALCGRWRHKEPCEWPHNNESDTARTPALFRTLFLAEPDDEAEVRRRIDGALANAHGWSLASSGPRAMLVSERPLARRLLAES